MQVAMAGGGGDCANQIQMARFPLENRATHEMLLLPREVMGLAY